MTFLPKNANWFRSYARCPCGRPSTGELYSTRNVLIGYFCSACAKKALKKKEKTK